MSNGHGNNINNTYGRQMKQGTVNII